MNVDNLVKDLLAGKTSDEIAVEMAEALNAAIKEKESIEAKEAEEKAKAAQLAEEEAIRHQQKITRMRKIFESVGFYVGDFHDENFGNEILEKVEYDEDVWELCKQFDELVEGFLAILQFADTVKSNKNAKFNTDLIEEIFGL
jgi:hypothetical protein